MCEKCDDGRIPRRYDAVDTLRSCHPDGTQPRADYLSWDECFMAIAIVAGMRSKDPSMQVGACIVGTDRRILSIGYNGSPNGVSDADFPWGKTGDWVDQKYPYVVHAERNAILNYSGPRSNLAGATLYVGLFPCNECAKEIVQSGISEVVYLSDSHHGDPEYVASRRLLGECGVRCRQLDVGPEGHRIVTVPLASGQSGRWA